MRSDDAIVLASKVIAYYGKSPRAFDATKPSGPGGPRSWHFFGYMDGHYGFLPTARSPDTLVTTDPELLMRAYDYARREYEDGRIDGEPMVYNIEINLQGPIDLEAILEDGSDRIRKKALDKLTELERKVLGLEE